MLYCVLFYFDKIGIFFAVLRLCVCFPLAPTPLPAKIPHYHPQFDADGLWGGMLV